MKIIDKICLILCLTVLTSVKEAHAFFIIIPNLEPLQGIVEGLDKAVVSPAMTYMEKARKIEQKVRSASTGKSAIAKKVFGPYSAKLQSIKDGNFGVKTVSYLKDVSYNPIKAQKVLAEEQVVKYGGGNDLDHYNEAEAKNKEILYEDLASLYALSLTTHARLLQEQENQAVAGEDLDQRDLIQATTVEAADAARLLSVNLLLEASKAYYRRNMQTSAIKEFVDSPETTNDTDAASGDGQAGDEI